jgi:hypothetical protein
MFESLTLDERMALSLKLRQAYDNLTRANWQRTAWQRMAYDTAIEIAHIRGDLWADR